ncbi:replicative DNA helicase [Hymenobacter sp. B81]|uniref:replicative DNA helicase n=1 Tax=Hymenobacter sp. B81 TaxID=3344878 RepID=UPI0037DC979F
MKPTHILPHDLAFEQVVLGTALYQRSALDTLLELLPEQAFHADKHQVIFRAVRALHEAGDPVDQLSLTRYFLDHGLAHRIGGLPYLAKISEQVDNAAGQEKRCRKLLELFAQRTVIRTGQLLEQRGHDALTDPLDILADAQQVLNDLHQVLQTRPADTLAALMPQVFDRMRAAVDRRGLTGLNTGLLALNDATGGWQPGELIVLAGRPGMGKTAALLHAVHTVAIADGLPVGVFSLEMPKLQLARRLVAVEVEGYTNKKLAKADFPGGLDEINQLERKAARLLSDRVFIDDTAGLSIQQLRARAKQMKATYDIRLLVIDYLQLMKGLKSGNREQEIASITRSLKEVAKELNIPVILLSQLSRSVETRGGDKRPQLSDLRESGSIEQDADMVIFLWRGEYYDIAEYQDGTSTADTILYDIAKQRDGATGELVFGCKIARGYFFDLSPHAAGEKGDFRPLPSSESFENPHEVAAPDNKRMPASKFEDKDELPF